MEQIYKRETYLKKVRGFYNDNEFIYMISSFFLLKSYF